MHDYLDCKNNLGYERADLLSALLPHGSGINGTWNITQGSDNRFFASNYYEAMQENGMYCHTYNFIVTYRHNAKTGKFTFERLNFRGQREYSCCGYGLRDYLEEYLYDIYI